VNVVISVSPKRTSKRNKIQPVVIAASTMAMKEHFIVVNFVAVRNNADDKMDDKLKLGQPEDWHRNGFGRFLLQFAYMLYYDFVSEKIVPMLLQTNASNESAISFYERLGFTRVEKKKRSDVVFNNLNWHEEAQTEIEKNHETLMLHNPSDTLDLVTFQLLPSNVGGLHKRNNSKINVEDKNKKAGDGNGNKADDGGTEQQGRDKDGGSDDKNKKAGGGNGNKEDDGGTIQYSRTVRNASLYENYIYL